MSLIVAVAVARAMPTVPFSSGAEMALTRIERALPVERVREMRRLLAFLNQELGAIDDLVALTAGDRRINRRWS